MRVTIDTDLFKQNVMRLRAELEDAEYARQNSQAKRNRDLEGSIFNAKVKADWLLSELEILEGEQLIAKANRG